MTPPAWAAVQPERERAAIAGMGRALGPQVLAAVQDLYRAEQDRLALAQPVTAPDLAYGDHPRQRLDLYAPDGATGAPVLLWVHGGGFVRGEKRSDDHPYGANVGRWAARAGMLGAVVDYRLAPDHSWPVGGEDVGAAVDWLRANASGHGGDPDRIVVAGTSAGAVHAATHLRLRGARAGVAGAVLLSGLYGFTPIEERDLLYYGEADAYPDRWPREAVVDTAVPLFVACAHYDPPRFQAETVGLLAARLARHDAVPGAQVVTGHNHFSLACHIGGADTRLSDAILGFVADLPAEQPA